MDASLHQRIDFQILSRSLGERQDSIRKHIDLYIDSTKQSLRELEKAERENNSEKWLAILHSMKQEAQTITAKRVAILCMEGEEIKELPHQRSKAAIYHLFKEFELLRELIGKHYNGGRDSIL